MDDLIAFLNARLGEDEAMVAEPHIWPTTFRPERVLREVAAKRKIIEIYEAAAAAGSNDPAIDYSIRMVLRSYATVWSGHLDYRQEWKP